MTIPINSIRDLAAVARGRRQRLARSQTEAAGQAGVSRQWLSEFEKGKPTAELGLVLRLFDSLGLQFGVYELGGGTSEPIASSSRVDLDLLLDEYGKP